MAVALIVAAGRGERLGADVPKALVNVCGVPMLSYCVRALQQVPRVREIVVALPADRLADAPAGVTVVPGGATRSESVLAALRVSGLAGPDTRLNAGPGSDSSSVAAADPDEAVIVHDAARIFAGPQLFERALDELERGGADAVIAAAPVTDTIKQLADDGQTVVSTVDRSRLWAVQTPQVFRRGALERALTGDPALLAQATDDAWLVEQQGGTVIVVEASADNFKITTALDLRLAELILAGERA